jgi:hypothetical protein
VAVRLLQKVQFLVNLSAASAATPTLILYGKTVMIAAFTALKGKNLWAGTSAGALIYKFNAVLFATRAESATDRIEFIFFLFEVIDINRYGADQHNEKKEQ